MAVINAYYTLITAQKSEYYRCSGNKWHFDVQKQIYL